MEVVPRKQIPYKGVTVEQMDTDAVIRRRPAVALAVLRKTGLHKTVRVRRRASPPW
ncbi:MAG: hypothetical protein JO057_31565 [Chloroflexi bacterium]|nr:hypothetical protein [Chloroflexota bacterium]